MISAEAATSSRSSDSTPKPRWIQVKTMTAGDQGAGAGDRRAGQQAVLEAEAGAHAVEPRLALAHEVAAVRVGAQAEPEHLRPDDGEQRARDHRVQLPLAAEQLDAGAATPSRPARRAAAARRRGSRTGGSASGRAGSAGGASRRGSSRASRRRRAGGSRSAAGGCRASPWRRGSPSPRRTPCRWCGGRARPSLSRRKARMPQWASRTPVRKKRLSVPERIGLPMYWCSHGMAPGWMPSMRSPITRSAPSSSCSRKRGISPKS